MDELSSGLPSKSAKIRRLASAGYQRADIARYLGIRYQFVYNVLSAPQPGAPQPGAPQPGAPRSTGARARQTNRPERSGSKQGASKPSDQSPDWMWTTVSRGGAIQIPKVILEAVGINEGDQVKLSREGDVITVTSRATALRDLQDHVRRYVPEGVSLVDQLLAERRAEAASETPERTDICLAPFSPR
jgi:AbrB family looped-hinge helix DNA binding protein